MRLFVLWISGFYRPSQRGDSALDASELVRSFPDAFKLQDSTLQRFNQIGKSLLRRSWRFRTCQHFGNKPTLLREALAGLDERQEAIRCFQVTLPMWVSYRVDNA